MIHVHCFGAKARPGNIEETALAEGQVRERCERALGCGIKEDEDEFRVRVVRDVGPRKNMLCASFRLPVEVSGVAKVVLPIISSSGVMEQSNGKREWKGDEGSNDNVGTQPSKKIKES